MRNEELFFDFSHPAVEPPKWAPLVERWYQLDSPAYGFCEFYSANASMLDTQKPTVIFLASPEGSTPTDWAFTSSGAASPAKFVHTLPNVRASSLCQVMNWYGPIVCIQHGERSFERAEYEAKRYLEIHGGTAWVMGHQERSGKNQVFARILRP